MKSSVRDQRGSVLIVELTLLGIVIASGGFTYYRVNQANKTAKVDVGSSVAHSKKPTVQPPPPAADPTATWVIYTDKVNNYQILIPDDWKRFGDGLAFS